MTHERLDELIAENPQRAFELQSRRVDQMKIERYDLKDTYGGYSDKYIKAAEELLVRTARILVEQNTKPKQTV
jgi:uncharacterized protein YdcH (DUF465 family)